MEHRAPGNSPAVAAQTGSKKTPRDNRFTWVLTAYGISGVALLGILAYYFSGYITQ